MLKKLLFLFLFFPSIAFSQNYELSSSGQNTGIGTASPNNTLGVGGNLAVGNATYTQTVAPSNGAIIQGNVGVGKTNPGTAFDVNGTIRSNGFTMSGATTNYVLTASDSAGDATWSASSTGSGTVNSGTANRLAVYATTGTAVSDQTVIYQNGTNVGVGSTLPGTTFDVQGTVRVLGSWNVGVSTVSPTQELNVNGDVSMSGGISNASWTDPINDWNASGSLATTTGTISSSSNSLVVASAAGYSVGMGISVANAGTAGNTPLISYITAISGTTFTLNDNAVTTATTQTVMHDDTRALKFAVNEACYDNKTVHLRQTGGSNGCYPVSSVITVNCPTWIFGDGARGDNTSQKGEVVTTNGTCIQNEGKTNNIFDVPTGNTIISDLAIQQDTAITPTAGFAIRIGIGSTREFSQSVQNVNIFGTYEGISIGPKVTGYKLYGNHVRTVTEPLFMSNADPSGDSFITDNYFGDTVATDTNLGSYFTCASINSVANNKFIDGNPPLKIDGAACASIGLRFENNSIENATGSNGLVQIVGGANGVTGLTFSGGEIGSDSGFGGVTISGSVDASFNHVTYSDTTGTVFTSSSSGTVENFDPILSNGSSPTGNYMAGNVGIASVNPNTPLDINTTKTYNGASVAAKLNTGSMYMKSPWNNGSGLLVPDVVEDSGGNARSILAIDTNNPPNTFINTPANTAISFITGGSSGSSPILKILSGGNVGIGSATPGQRFDVQGTVRSIGFITTGGYTQSGISANSFTGTPTFSNATYSALFSGGNVGIGSATPGSNLDVQGTIRALTSGACSSLYKCVGGVDAGVIQTVTCGLCPGGTCTQMNLCG